MTNKLKSIILQKEHEVGDLKKRLHKNSMISNILRGNIQKNSNKIFSKALRGSSLSIIGEIKRRSPSKGNFAPIADPSILAKTYIEAGVNAISILTDELFFSGKIEDLENVAQSHYSNTIPLLQKDFVIDEIQIAQGIAAGADAILCIVSVLGERTVEILNAAKRMGIEALVEVYTEKELNIALKSGAEMIAINNRNLTTFEVDPNHALRFIEKIPKNLIRVAASGILDPKIARDFYQAGFDAVLIGEALVKSENPKNFIGACRHV